MQPVEAPARHTITVPLHPNVMIDIFRSTELSIAKSGELDNQGVDLSSDGVRQAQQLSVVLHAYGIHYDLAVYAATPRARRMAHAVLGNHRGAWYRGQGRDLYAPRDDRHYNALLALDREIKSRRFGKFTPVVSADVLDRAEPLFEAFLRDTRQVFASIKKIEEMRRIAIFADTLMTGEALLPHLAESLREIDRGFAHGEWVQLSHNGCIYHKRPM